MSAQTTADVPEHAAGHTAPASDLAACSMREFAMYFLRLGTLGFGGPIALAAYMHPIRDILPR